MKPIEYTSYKVLPKAVIADLPQTCELSQDQLKFYAENGYLVIKELIDFTSLYSYKQRFIQICNGVVDKGGITMVKLNLPLNTQANLKSEDYVNKIQEILYDDVFYLYGTHPRMLHVLSQLIGDDITAVHSMFINKPPGTGRHPPHQDLHYFPFRPADKIVASWTAVDQVREDNGCLYVIPGSHKQETLYEHGNVPDAGVLYHGILKEDTVAPHEARVNLEMSPGDTVFFHPYLVHGSGPNISKHYRKAITFHFAHSSCHYIDVRGTTQEHVAREVEAIAAKKGFPGLSIQKIWSFKSRQVKGVRSNL